MITPVAAVLLSHFVMNIAVRIRLHSRAFSKQAMICLGLVLSYPLPNFRQDVQESPAVGNCMIDGLLHERFYSYAVDLYSA